MSIQFPNKINIFYGNIDNLTSCKDLENLSSSIIWYPCNHALPNEKIEWVCRQFEKYATFTDNVSIVTNDVIMFNALEVFLRKYNMWEDVGLYIIQEQINKVDEAEEIYSLTHQTFQDLENIEYQISS